MSVIALAVHAEVAFVAAHHIIRIFVVMVAAAPVYALLDRLRSRCIAAGSSPSRIPAE